MPSMQKKRQKVIDGLKGVILTCEFKPTNIDSKSLEPEFRKVSLSKWYEIGGKSFDLYYKVEKHDIVIRLVDRLYPGETSYRNVSSLIKNILEEREWIDGKDKIKDRNQLEQIGKDFLDRVEAEIKNRKLFLPIEGLDFQNHESLTIGNCELHSNRGDSSFKRVMYQDAKRDSKESDDEVEIDDKWNKIRAYFTCEIEADHRQAIKRSIEEANISLNILRLYRASNYFHELSRSRVYRMGLYGSLQLGERSEVFYINPIKPIDDQFPGQTRSRTLYKSFVVDSNSIEYMNDNCLEQINTYVKSLELDNDKGELARRFLRTLTWFGKATCATNIADSYLMYAIALESLLSESRTSKETYALQVSFLFTCGFDNDNLIFPASGNLSTGFSKQISKKKNQKEKIDVIRDRIIELFRYRNKIAHGAIVDSEIEEVALLDFEEIVRYSILAFANRGWEKFSDFKTALQNYEDNNNRRKNILSRLSDPGLFWFKIGSIFLLGTILGFAIGFVLLTN